MKVWTSPLAAPSSLGFGEAPLTRIMPVAYARPATFPSPSSAAMATQSIAEEWVRQSESSGIPRNTGAHRKHEIRYRCARLQRARRIGVMKT